MRFPVVLFAATLALAGAMAPATASAQSPPPDGTGALRVVDADGRAGVLFPLRHTDVRAEVSGNIARVVVEQEFHNPFETGIEAVYVFPLPHTAAVDELEMEIGDRIVRGEIRTRATARRAYERARQEGRMAALLEQERPNIFTQQVTNIQPGHSIRVRIRYVDMLEHRDGGYEMVIPTVVGPRFIPGTPLSGAVNIPASHPAPQRVRPEGALEPGTGWSPDTDRVPDASRITPLVVPPGMRAGHDIAIQVDVDAGMALQSVACPSHAVVIERPGKRAARIRLRPSDTIPNKDFILRYDVAGDTPEFGLLAHRESQRDGTFALFFQPEAEVSAREARPKEIIFILDTSGSMSGEPIARSKAAMRWALQHLDTDDSFQIIRFSDAVSSFAPQPLPCSLKNVQRALRYVDALEGSGGTHMLAGIEAALDLPPHPERLRIVCMLTDGYIGNETEILAAVRQKIGDARLFSFGIGSSVNRYLLDELAEEGRGCVDYVSLDGAIAPIVERFYGRIARPYLTDITLEWRGVEVEGVYPARLPDLFAGHPLVVVGRYTKPGRGELIVHGKLGREKFVRRVPVQLPRSSAGHAALATVWARRRIDTLMQRMVRGEDPLLVAEVTAVALEHRLMSRYTSFVAVDNQVVTEDGNPAIVPQPVEMPVGVSDEGVFGGLLSLPAESAASAAATNSGVVVGGGTLYIRGGRSSEVRLREAAPMARAMPKQIMALPPKSAAAMDAAEPAGDPLATEALEIRLQPEQDQLLRGDRIRVVLTLRNTSRDPVMVPLVLTAEDLVLRIERDGHAVSDDVYRPRAWRQIALAPGEIRTYQLVFEWPPGAFTAAGHYRVGIVGIGAGPEPSPATEALAWCEFAVR